jgi:hypothetical protein
MISNITESRIVCKVAVLMDLLIVNLRDHEGGLAQAGVRASAERASARLRHRFLLFLFSTYT